ncbi:MAG: ATP-dependent DNA helicase RecG [Peptoniphilaceae bacterium]|nr:ATP-dependent DNA helicase RecG [Peptoniphilaceae bacterium]MDY6019401.1 ATP-dependent DNA helicase RecG [Anaerococcus sp.]
MDLKDLKGIGKKREEALNKLDIYTISDLYNYYPREYEDRSKKMILPKAREDIKYFFRWKIESKLYYHRSGSYQLSYLYASEKKEKIKIIYFNDKFTPQKLLIGKTYNFYCKIVRKNGFYEAYNPIFSELDDKKTIGSIIALYPLTKGLNLKTLRKLIQESLKYYDKNEEVIDKETLEYFKLNKREENLNQIHFPKTIKDLKKAKSQIKINDLLKDLYFLDLVKNQKYTKQSLKLSYNLPEILNKLDFALTRGQKRSLLEILKDSLSEKPMNRLLCGDVGSGKTIVAILTMIIFAINGYQSAMMVPTEVLAIQQFEKNKDFIESFGLKVSLITSSSKDKKTLKDFLADGKIDIIIGTHALIQEDVSFKNLKLVVNDEQHRFGVMQRQKLAQKGINPNYLTMTATPIPRTLYLKIAKLLDISIIDELPKNRLPIETEIISNTMEETLFEKLFENLRNKRQIYVVSNNIDGEDRYSVENLYKKYKKVFRDYRIEKLHGKLNPNEKEQILKDFSKGIIDILITTTVIEVGIDVKNASVMVIYNASMFGLSTLHQLRGRVGRGPYKSYCYLVSNKESPSKKLEILKKSNDGFEIAKYDLEMRGGGKILSTIQHGKNLENIDYLSMTKEEIDKAFEIYFYTKENNFCGVNFNYIKKYFNLDRGIILN